MELNGKTLLVVDDEEGLRKAIGFEFSRKGFNVVSAENGLLAQEILIKQKVDIVISDIRMPGGDGVELLKWIKSNQPKTPCVIFITAFADLSAEDAFSLGAEAVFSKPFDRKALRAAVEKCLMPREQRWAANLPSESPPVDISWSNGESAGGQVINLGRGGMFVSMTSAIPKAETSVKFSFEFSLNEGMEPPKKFAIEGVGIVRWSRTKSAEGKPAGCGIEFVGLSDSCRTAIVQWIENINTGNSFIPLN